ncbi:MAG: flagellar biosynthesis anti-sigma factor FlgM [Campylobacterota bacterium]
MISQLNSAGIRSAYAGNLGENKEVAQKSATVISKQGDKSRIEEIKSALESGEYKINLQDLSQKIAEELL